MTCDRCVELEAQVEALLDELHDARVALADVWAVREAVARQRHPSTRGDICPPNGIRRPVLHLIGGGE
jgi:hypothetical protein